MLNATHNRSTQLKSGSGQNFLCRSFQFSSLFFPFCISFPLHLILPMFGSSLLSFSLSHIFFNGMHFCVVLIGSCSWINFYACTYRNLTIEQEFNWDPEETNQHQFLHVACSKSMSLRVRSYHNSVQFVVFFSLLFSFPLQTSAPTHKQIRKTLTSLFTFSMRIEKKNNKNNKIFASMRTFELFKQFYDQTNRIKLVLTSTDDSHKWPISWFIFRLRIFLMNWRPISVD